MGKYSIRWIVFLLVVYLTLHVYYMMLKDSYRVTTTTDAVDIGSRISRLESLIDENNEIVRNIQQTLKTKLLTNDIEEIKDMLDNSKEVVGISRGETGMTCMLTDAPVDIKMFHVQEEIWTNTWRLIPNPVVWGKETYDLHVIVVPHSHMDPGWTMSFDIYYNRRVKYILDTMLVSLEKDTRRRFVVAEMVYFSRWWSQCSANKKQRIRRLIKDGRLEVVTGGWVMTDEATVHYSSMLDQLIEGHSWVKDTFGVTPTSGWAIDPFGHSSTMAYLLKRSGLDNMLIQRVHYNVKELFAKKKQLEFMWRQQWDNKGTTDILCHMMPYWSYSVLSSCGPDYRICLQFDFARPYRFKWPWEEKWKPPSEIDDNNVKERANALLGQYRQKAARYRSDVILVPLGDDFRYVTEKEAHTQLSNHQKLFDYMNAHQEMRVNVRFGTLSEYFNKLHELNESQDSKKPQHYPTLSGDFFTYADKSVDFWSGYYTSRPYFKHFVRILEHYLRAAELVFTIANAVNVKLSRKAFPSDTLFERLTSSRRALGLFQHHDAITGTSREYVMADYGQRLWQAFMDCKDVFEETIGLLIMKKREIYDYIHNGLPFIRNDPPFKLVESWRNYDSLLTLETIDVSRRRDIIIFNSLAQAREQVVSIHVSYPLIILTDSDGKKVHNQINAIWDSETKKSQNKFKVYFIAKLPAFGFTKYSVIKSITNSAIYSSFSSTTFYSDNETGSQEEFPFVVHHTTPQDFTLENSNFIARFSGESGLLKVIEDKHESQATKAELHFVTYDARNNSRTSGAYLFLPEGPSKTVPMINPLIRITRGAIVSEVSVHSGYVQHVVRIFNSPGIDSLSLHIDNFVDIRGQVNREIAMKISTNVSNENGEFYSDLNGFQMHKRRTYKDKPIQANIYPMTAQAFIEDRTTRFSLLSAQSLGVASHEKGDMEVMLDRCLKEGDHRGLGEGILDNKLTHLRFALLLEYRNKSPVKDTLTGYPSIVSHSTYLHLVHPPLILARSDSSLSGVHFRKQYSALTHPLPCDVHLVNLRTIKDTQNQDARDKLRTEAALILHRLGSECGIPPRGLSCTATKISIGSLFYEVDVHRIMKTSLTLMHDIKEIDKDSEQDILPMEIDTFKLSLY